MMPEPHFVLKLITKRSSRLPLSDYKVQTIVFGHVIKSRIELLAFVQLPVLRSFIISAAFIFNCQIGAYHNFLDEELVGGEQHLTSINPGLDDVLPKIGTS